MNNKYYGLKTEYSPIREDSSRVIISYGYESVDKKHGTWYEVALYKRQTSALSFADIKAAVLADINARTDAKIVSGYVWDGKSVWLSGENQFNFKAIYDRAVQTEGAILPVTFKIGETEDGAPVYHTFDTLEDLKSFYEGAVEFILATLAEGWQEKDAIDWSPWNTETTEEQQ